jgi:wobble nucleotide-excising tRNase
MESQHIWSKDYPGRSHCDGEGQDYGFSGGPCYCAAFEQRTKEAEERRDKLSNEIRKIERRLQEEKYARLSMWEKIKIAFRGY